MANEMPFSTVRKSPSSVAPGSWPELPNNSWSSPSRYCTPSSASSTATAVRLRRRSWPATAATSRVQVGMQALTTALCSGVVRAMPSVNRIWFSTTPNSAAPSSCRNCRRSGHGRPRRHQSANGSRIAVAATMRNSTQAPGGTVCRMRLVKT